MLLALLVIAGAYAPPVMRGRAVIFASFSCLQDAPPDTAAYRPRVLELSRVLTAFVDSLHDAGVEEVFTLGFGGNAPTDPLEKMDQVRRDAVGFNNPEANRISGEVQRWGRALRWEFRDLKQPLVTRVVIQKGAHTSIWYHENVELLRTDIAVGNPLIGKATPEGAYHVLYVDFKPISRWIRGNVPYGHEYNPYGARQIPFYQDWTMHGNNDATALGKDISKGCVRFHNAEILALAELVLAVRTRVDVVP